MVRWIHYHKMTVSCRFYTQQSKRPYVVCSRVPFLLQYSPCRDLPQFWGILQQSRLSVKNRIHYSCGGNTFWSCVSWLVYICSILFDIYHTITFSLVMTYCGFCLHCSIVHGLNRQLWKCWHGNMKWLIRPCYSLWSQGHGDRTNFLSPVTMKCRSFDVCLPKTIAGLWSM